MRHFIISLLFISIFCVNSSAQTVPQSYFGIWKGVATERGAYHDGQLFDVEITITGGKNGEVVADVNYPSYSCGGQLFLEQTEVTGILLFEKLTFGYYRCANSGYLILNFTDEGLQYYWYHNTLPNKAEGLLTRHDVL